MSFPGLGKTSKTPFRSGVNSALADSLYGDIDAKLPLEREQLHHRRFIEMAEAGYTIREISDATGYTKVSVSNTLRQPWARERMIQNMRRTTQDELKEMLERASPDSLRRIMARAADPNAKPEVQQRADEYLLNRFLGTPTQTVNLPKQNLQELTDDELNAIAARGLASESVAASETDDKT
jgi:lambda repressor-like predicted transcriptional regulator